MSRETSPDTGKPYGLEWVCRVLEFPRSTIYAQQARQTGKVVSLHPPRRGPKPKMADADLLAAIRADSHLLALRRRRLSQDVGATAPPLRYPRVRGSPLPPAARECASVAASGTAGCTHAARWLDPDRVAELDEGTDGIRILTVEDGWVWVFSAVDHYDACYVGLHAAKIGHLFAALQPIAQDLAAESGSTSAHAGKGLKLRMDHGAQSTADDFLKQIGFYGIDKSLGIKAEPQTNGVAERFNRTLQEQAIPSRLFCNLEEVCQAVTEFRERYNRHWRLEKPGFRSPLEARLTPAIRKAA
jgi:transposase InsO family protein